MSPLASAVPALLAADESDVTPGVLGFVVVALLAVATYLLVRSMNRQIRKIDLPDDERRDEPGGSGRDAPEDPGGRSG